MKRIMIIGSAGSGKSTLARKLGKVLDLPVTHIDKLYWKPGWVMRPIEDAKASVQDVANREAWILEGNWSSSFPERKSRADTIVFLDMPRWLCIYRVVFRTLNHRGKSREDMAEECSERLDWEYLKFLKFIYDYPAHSRPKSMELLKNAPEYIRVWHLKSTKEVNAFINTIKHRQLVA